MRKIAVMIGSDSDLAQCAQGLDVLRIAESEGSVKVLSFETCSLHRNTEEVLDLIWSDGECDVDVWIIGAGMANHLTGTCDAYLRYHMSDTTTEVVGVAFDGGADHPEWTEAAKLSISQVPGTQVVWHNGDGEQFVGEDGFYRACKWAVMAPELPTIKQPEPKETKTRTLAEAQEAARAAVEAANKP